MRHIRQGRRRRRRLRSGCLLTLIIITLGVFGLLYWIYATPTALELDTLESRGQSSSSNGYANTPDGNIQSYDYEDEYSSTASANSTPLISVQKSSLFSTDYLKLVNREHGFAGLDYNLLTQAWPTVPVSHIYGLYVHQTALAAAGRMFASFREANPDLSTLFVSSGYRDVATQAQLYADNYGSGYVQPPGHSEHHTGLAVDIFAVGVGQWDFGNSLEGQWLAANAYRYGFILRYPSWGTAITGINYEPWHFRYVGYPHAYLMHSRGMVLEEYIRYILDAGYLSFVFDGARYHVLHQTPVDGTVNVPYGKDFMVSLDNIGGVVILWSTQL